MENDSENSFIKNSSIPVSPGPAFSPLKALMSEAGLKKTGSAYSE